MKLAVIVCAWQASQDYQTSNTQVYAEELLGNWQDDVSNFY